MRRFLRGLLRLYAKIPSRHGFAPQRYRVARMRRKESPLAHEIRTDVGCMGQIWTGYRGMRRSGLLFRQHFANSGTIRSQRYASCEPVACTLFRIAPPPRGRTTTIGAFGQSTARCASLLRREVCGGGGVIPHDTAYASRNCRTPRYLARRIRPAFALLSQRPYRRTPRTAGSCQIYAQTRNTDRLRNHTQSQSDGRSQIW